MDDRLEGFIDRRLLLGLETGPSVAVHKIGAVRQGAIFLWEGRFETPAALAELDDFAAEAEFVLGHNLLGHNLPCLRSWTPELGLLRLPVVDSLYLSPLPFPENPYQRLVKDYKLVRDSLSDPMADAKLAGRVFGEQWEEFARRAETGARDLLSLYQFCLQDAIDLDAGSGAAEALQPPSPAWERSSRMSARPSPCAVRVLVG